MALDKETRDLLYKAQMNQKISIYMSLFSTFGMFVGGILAVLFINDIFTSLVPVVLLDFAIMLYFFRSFVGMKKQDYEQLYIFQKLKVLRTFLRSRD